MKTETFSQWCENNNSNKYNDDNDDDDDDIESSSIPSQVWLIPPCSETNKCNEGLTGATALCNDSREEEEEEEDTKSWKYDPNATLETEETCSCATTRQEQGDNDVDDDRDTHQQDRQGNQIKPSQGVKTTGGDGDEQNENDWRDWRRLLRQTGWGVAIAGVTVATGGLALTAAGFGTTGIMAGSMAAGIQSSIGNVAAGSTFTLLQSAGATGTIAAWTSAGAATAAGGGAVASIAGRRGNNNNNNN